jgi:hypothetical protein
LIIDVGPVSRSFAAPVLVNPSLDSFSNLLLGIVGRRRKSPEPLSIHGNAPDRGRPSTVGPGPGLHDVRLNGLALVLKCPDLSYIPLPHGLSLSTISKWSAHTLGIVAGISSRIYPGIGGKLW